ncbi:hypothetical protein [Pantoea sp. JKS000250]|uniref:hypothetical protein n=1 Tax=Pantoea sp. JKS000250 TaxID=1938795 RepID=UPI000D767CC3|nr:hypothetical protein [Pantoea sp. JKS000250]PXW18593.1 hypothetical protein BY447_0146 [Pantoea sp. JKS000250]
MEWFDKNATAIIAASAALLSALIAGGFAILNAWLTNNQNNQRLQLQIDHEKVRESKKLFLDKGEELFLCVDKWITSGHAHLLTGEKLLRKQITPEQRLNLLSSYTDGDNYTRMQTLLTIYFADLIEFKQECSSNLMLCEDVVDGFINGNYADVGDALSAFKTYSDFFQTWSDEFSISLQKKLMKQVRN